MKNMRFIGAWMMILILFSPAAGFADACIRCHTDDLQMKTLFVPPQAHAAEEGEG